MLSACVAPAATCVSIHFSAGPWHASQLTPSPALKRSPRSAAGGLCVWQSRQTFAWCAGSLSPRLRAMRCERSFRRTWYALVECLSTRDHVTYSFCRMLESFQLDTDPWQRLLAQLTTPRVVAVDW